MARTTRVHPLHDQGPPGDEEEQGPGRQHHLCLRLPRVVQVECGGGVEGLSTF